MTEQQTQEDLNSLLEGLGIEALIELDVPQENGRDKVGGGLGVKEADFDMDDDRGNAGFPKTATAPACLPTYDSADPWLQSATAMGLLSMPTAPLELLPRMASMPAPTGLPTASTLTAEDLERDLLMGINVCQPVPMADPLDALMANPFMQQISPNMMMMPPGMLMRDPLALPEDDEAGKKRRRRRRRPKKDRRDDPAYWESRPPADQCMIVPIMESDSVAAMA
eukprot:TRINITY_DN4177_c0_g1_i2.p1 TRINITY_DN4177_c0_g1~~TRINITY_DN4177_c0_g1_i2.p1  ORF type:complete len:224 (+),score=45.79 TRINITY_DN4177_c0_g1_i2:175-846(+)